MIEPHADWMSIAKAASAARLPVRTIYNWVRSGSLESHKEAGATTVRLADVLAKAGEREAICLQPALLPAPIAGAEMPATDAGMDAARCLELLPSKARYALAPELLAYLIRRFEEGTSLQNIVEQQRLPPELVVEARRQYDLLVAASGQPPLLARMAELEGQMKSHREAVELRLREIQGTQWAADTEQSNQRGDLAADITKRIAETQATWNERLLILEQHVDRVHKIFMEMLRSKELVKP